MPPGIEVVTGLVNSQNGQESQAEGPAPDDGPRLPEDVVTVQDSPGGQGGQHRCQEKENVGPRKTAGGGNPLTKHHIRPVILMIVIDVQVQPFQGRPVGTFLNPVHQVVEDNLPIAQFSTPVNDRHPGQGLDAVFYLYGCSHYSMQNVPKGSLREKVQIEK
ncbi:hypothetical protein ES703_67344 [subsurface metagenome]